MHNCKTSLDKKPSCR